MTAAFTDLRAAEVSVQASCALTEISRATYYRRASPPSAKHGPWLPRRPPPSALTDAERAAVLQLLTSPAYADLAIPQVWARELDEGRYHCSISTMYRIARAAGQVLRTSPAGHPSASGTSGIGRTRPLSKRLLAFGFVQWRQVFGGHEPECADQPGVDLRFAQRARQRIDDRWAQVERVARGNSS
ncbi:hypothetical protein [Kibdelosporangium philippinense]|uniref:hypothetical protein n=1 Tax=Kibdelosporangium philippinense TaxID=211113 RepID=UPI00361AAAA1